MVSSFDRFMRFAFNNRITKISVSTMTLYILFHILTIPFLAEIFGVLTIFLPGFLLTKVIFKGIEIIQSETIIFTITLSISLITVIMLILNYSGLGITFINLIIAISMEVLLILLMLNYSEFKSA